MATSSATALRDMSVLELRTILADAGVNGAAVGTGWLVGAMIGSDVTALIGRTPMVELARLASGLPGRVLAKLEMFNPAGSVKDRVAVAMIEDAERKGALRQGMTIVEPTGGNTGIGLAFVAAIRG